MSVRQLLTAATLLAILAHVGHSQTAQSTYFKASNAGPDDLFGFSMDSDGDTLVVGAASEGSSATGVNGDQSSNAATGSGAAYVFVKTPTGWVQEAYLKASNTEALDGFGIAVAISGDTIVVGASYEDSGASGVNGNQADNSLPASGAAYVFVRTGTTWSQQAYIKASNPGTLTMYAGDEFGSSVEISGETICVGAPGESSAATGLNGNQADDSAFRAGAAYTFQRTGTTWIQSAYIKASNTDAGDEFGFDVTVEANLLAVGAIGEDSQATGINGLESDNSLGNSGAVYVFVASGPSWMQQAYIKASSQGSDVFGWAVDLSGNTLAVGAPGEESSATGVNGNQADNSLYAAGAAYVFTRSGSTWTQQAYLKPFTANPNLSYGSARFGSSLAIDQDQLITGAPGSRVGLRGVDGHASYKSTGDEIMNMGAAFTFSRLAGNWSLQSSLASPAPQGGDSGYGGDMFGLSVAVAGNQALAGASGEKSQSSGINSPFVSSGSAYGAVFAFDSAAACGVFRYGAYAGTNTGDLYGSWLPTPGSPFTFEYDWLGPAPSTAMLLISIAPASNPLLGGTLLVDPALSAFGPGSIIGVPYSFHSALSYTLPIPTGTAGLTFFAQVANFTSSPGLTYTNGLEVTVCP